MADFNVDINTKIARELGLIGPNETAGGGLVQQRLEANPNKAASYEQKRRQYAGQEGYAFAASTPTGNPAVPINQYTANQVQNPALPTGTTQVPVLQNAQANELLPNPTPIASTQVTGMNNQINTPTLTAGQAETATVDPNSIPAPQAGNYQAQTVSDQTPQNTAVQGTVNEKATVQGQLKDLYAGIKPGETTPWAQGAQNAANDASASRGLGASTIGTTALFAATQAAALPIAAADSATYFQMDMQNLNFQQQTMLENTRLKQQSLLSDQSATNAALQFNASSQQQVQEFMASMITSIKTQNATMTNNMAQFNVSEKNKTDAQNAGNTIVAQQFQKQQDQALATFNAQLEFNRNTFNAQQQAVVDQSNVLWRRQLNTQNTAALNVANQTNTQNLFNMSAQAQNNLWQQWRDEASWMFQSSESEKDRQANIAASALNRQYQSELADDASTASLYQTLGSFAANLWK